MSLFKSLKDKTLSFGAEKFLKNKLERYGDMLELKINSEEKSVYSKMILKGEKEPLSITINGYKIVNKNGSDYLQFDEIITSKEWMNLLIADFIKTNELKLQQELPGFIKMLL